MACPKLRAPTNVLLLDSSSQIMKGRIHQLRSTTQDMANTDLLEWLGPLDALPGCSLTFRASEAVT